MRNFEPLSSTSCIYLKTHIKKLNGNPTMRLCSMPFLLLPLLLFSIPSPSFALKRAYVVYIGVLSHGAEVSEIDLLQVQESHFDILGSFIGSRDIAKDSIFYSYTRHINGFAAMLEDEEASAISMDIVSLAHKTNKGRGILPADHHRLCRAVHPDSKLREWDVRRSQKTSIAFIVPLRMACSEELGLQFFSKNLNPFHCWCRKCGSGKEAVMQEWLTYKEGNCTLVTLALNWVE